MAYTGLDLIPGEGGTAVSFQMTHGYQFTPRLSTGVGLGFSWYGDPLDFIPLFVDLRYKILEANTTHYLALKAGTGFSILREDQVDDNLRVRDHDGGFVFTPTLGIQFASGGEVGWYLQAGYSIANGRYERSMWGGRFLETDLSYRRLLFGLGLSF